MNQEAIQKNILLVTTRLTQLMPFVEDLHCESRMQIKTAGSAEEALEAARQNQIALTVVDDRIGETTGLSLVKRLIETDAFMQTAVLSDVGKEDFHARSEGLGVLAKLPLAPEPGDARRLCELLRSMPH